MQWFAILTGIATYSKVKSGKTFSLVPTAGVITSDPLMPKN